MPKYMPTGTHGASHIQWQRKVMHMRHWTAPRIFHYISFTLHFICITLHLHLKIVPRQHEMHDTSRFKCHALHLHFMK